MPPFSEALCATSSPPLVLYHTCAIAAQSRSSATIARPSHRRLSSGERPLGSDASPSLFPPSHGELSCTGAVTRPCSGEPGPSALAKSSTDSWTGHPCVVHGPWTRSMWIFHSKIIPKPENPCRFAKNPMPFCKIKPQSTNFQTEPLESKNISRLALATF
jgi:hypothetical protein